MLPLPLVRRKIHGKKELPGFVCVFWGEGERPKKERMGEHFVLVFDNLNIEPSIELSSERFSCNRFYDDSETEKESVSELKSLLQCRICHDDDIDSSMEVPCSCSGSFKYAHRKCIQRWCNEKGNTKCEICLKQFEPNYTAPPPLFQYGGTPKNFRGNWEISRHGEDDSRVVRIRRVPSDNFTIPGPRAMVYYWSTALVVSSLEKTQILFF